MKLQGCHLHIDGVSGAAGDMTLGALIDVGVPVEVIRGALAALGHAELLSVERVKKSGIVATNVVIREHGGHHHHHHGEDGHGHGHGRHPDGHGHGHGHHDDEHHDDGHGHHHHTAYRDIRKQIEAAPLAASVRRRALDIFERLARAEAAIHGTTVDDVHFHEVGAIDAICDVVGAAAGFEWLETSSVSAGAIVLGQGGIRSEHGVLPVPSPAAVRILAEVGAPVKGGGVDRELCTPTGAAILASIVTAWGTLPEIVPLAIGYGAGDAELADRPNVLRMTAGHRPDPRAGEEEMLLVRANLDDMNPEWCEQIATRLLQAGAVDVWWTPIVMKKSRPALELSTLVAEGCLDPITEIFFRDATTLGVRYDRVSRRILARRIESVETPYGPISMKVGSLGAEEVNAAPEYETCREAAERTGAPLKEVYGAALAAWRARRVVS